MGRERDQRCRRCAACWCSACRPSRPGTPPWLSRSRATRRTDPACRGPGPSPTSIRSPGAGRPRRGTGARSARAAGPRRATTTARTLNGASAALHLHRLLTLRRCAQAERRERPIMLLVFPGLLDRLREMPARGPALPRPLALGQQHRRECSSTSRQCDCSDPPPAAAGSSATTT